MKIWACLELRDTGPLGLESRTSAELGGRTVLEHTVARVSKTRRLEGVAVLTEPGKGTRVREMLGQLAASTRVLEVLEPDSARREALRRSRKWSLDGWRLGIKQSMEVDAAGHFPSLAAAGRQLGADAILLVLPEAVLVGPELLEGLIDHGAPEGHPPLPTAVCQVPGGFAGLFAMVGWLEPMAAKGITYGEICAWTPERATQDPVGRAENWLAPVPVRRCEFRGSVDSTRSAELIAEILRRAPGPDGLGPDALEAVSIVAGDPALYAGRIPRMVEVELTTAGRVPFADTPEAMDLPERQISGEIFEKILEDLSTYDDVLLTLGGFGDPLAHPDLCDLLHRARGKGVYGLHLQTTGVLLDERKAAELLEAEPDVISVRLGAGGADTYKGLTGRDDYERVAAGIESLVRMRNESGREWPFILVEAEKRTEVEGELIGFFDRWSESADWPVIRPCSDYCGQVADRATVHLNLAERTACRRIMKEMLILADGTVPVCRMDFLAREPAGNVSSRSVEELWTSGRLAALRGEQAEGRFGGFELCPSCRDWDGI